MERINHVKIENFRNIKSLEFNVNSDATIVAGRNGIGKSNVVNSLVWFFSDSIYTDNLGVGENDINSIVPNDQVKGERVAVEVTFTSGAVLRKEYVTGYDRATGKANKHTTKGYVNGVESKNLDEFKSVLYKQVGYEPTINTSIKEVNLFIDPLYALQKIDSKDLRQLLMKLGCSVTNEELFNLGFDDLRQYESKYMGNYSAMRVDLKKQIKSINDSLKKYDVLRNQYNEVEPVNQTELDSINARLEELNEKISALKISGVSDLIKEKTIKLNTMIASFTASKNTKLKDLGVQKQSVSNEIEMIKKNKEIKFTAKSSKLKTEIANEQASINSLQYQLKSLEEQKNTLRSRLGTIQIAAKQVKESKQRNSNILLETKSKEFTGYVCCPECGTQFAPNEEELVKFNQRKDDDIKFCTNQIASSNLMLEKYVKEVNEIKVQAGNIDKQVEDINSKLEEKKVHLSELEIELGNIIVTADPADEAKITELEAKRESLEEQEKAVKSMFSGDEPSVQKLQEEIISFGAKQATDIEEAMATIRTEIAELEAKREEFIIQKSKYDNKCLYSKQYDSTLEELNNVEALASRVDEFIHKMIACINSKAQELTGIEFVMLEENIGNDGIKEVCYALVDGVPFANVNTAKKYITGIRFIQRLKAIVQRDFEKPRNTLPILADKFEGIDSVTTIKNLTAGTGDQLICSRVTDDKEMRFM